MNSLLLADKKDKAFERLAIGIKESAANCTTVIKKLNTICQNPEDYPNPHELITKWSNHVFTNYFHDFIEEWILPKTISIENQERLGDVFFNYFASLTPFFYHNKIILSPDFPKPKKYKWTNKNFEELKWALLRKWFIHDDDELNKKEQHKIESRMIESVKQIQISIKAKNSFWNKTKKINEVFSLDSVMNVIKEVMPNYQHQYQTDLFLLYTSEFINKLPSSFAAFDSDFYEIGTYLHNIFQWSGK